MRSVLIFTIAIVAVFCLPIFAQNIEYVSSTLWSGAQDIEYVGDYAYCAFMNGFLIFDASNLENLEIASKIDFLDGSSKIKVMGDYAFLQLYPWQLCIIDISDPYLPDVVGYVDDSMISEIFDYFLIDNYLYVGLQFPDDGFVLTSSDYSDPLNPQSIGLCELPERPACIYVNDDYAYVATGDSGVQIVDVNEMEIVSRYQTFGSASDVQVVDDLLFVAEGGLDIVDVSNLLNPNLIGQYGSQDMIIGAHVSGQYAYLTIASWHDGSPGGCEIANIINPESPTWIGYGPGILLSMQDDFCFFNNNGYGPDLRLYSMSDPANPILYFEYPVDQPQDVFIAGDFTYVVDNDLKIVDISNPSQPVWISSFATPGSAIEIVVQDNYAYIADGDSGLCIVDVSNPANPSFVGRYDQTTLARRVCIRGEYVYLTDSFNFYIIDVSNPEQPILMDSYETESRPCDVGVFENFVYVTWRTLDPPVIYSLDIFDISDPNNINRINTLIQPDYSPRIYIQDSYLYMSMYDDYYSLRIFSLADPGYPVSVGRVGLEHHTHNIIVEGDYAYMPYAEYESGIYIMDVSNPGLPVISQDFRLNGYPQASFSRGEYIYVTNNFSLMVLRFTPSGIERVGNKPIRLSLIPNYPNPFNAQTTIGYSLPFLSNVSIDIYDILGRHVDTMQPGMLLPGYHQATWRADGFSSGVYFYKLQAGDFAETRKMVLIK